MSFCSDGLVGRPGRKAEAVDCGGVDRSDDRSKGQGGGGMVTGVVAIEPVRVGREE